MRRSTPVIVAALVSWSILQALAQQPPPPQGAPPAAPTATAPSAAMPSPAVPQGGGGGPQGTDGIWLGVGDGDFALNGTKALDEVLTKNNIKHTLTVRPGYRHEWRLWRQDLWEFVPLLFQDHTTKRSTRLPFQRTERRA